MNLIKAPFTWFWKRSWKTKIGIVILLLIGFWAINQAVNKDDPGSAYTTELPSRGTITEVISETGNVTTVGALPVYSTVTGIVEEVYVRNGFTVAEDSELFKVKSTASEEERVTAWSNYQAALAALKNAENSRLSAQAALDHVIDDIHLFQYGNGGFDNVGSANETQAQKTLREQSEATLRSAVNSETSARAQYVAASIAYQATQDGEIKAIIGGEVQNLAVAPGDLVAVPPLMATAETPSSPTLIIVDNNVKTFVKIFVNEADAIKVQPGQKASVEFDAIDGRSFSAKVERVDTIATNVQGVIQFAIYIVLDEKNELVQRGMSADVDITVASKDDALTVPSSAIKPYQGGRAVRILDANGEIQFIPVEIGLRGDGKTEIVSGVEESVPVIVVAPSDQSSERGGFF